MAGPLKDLFQLSSLDTPQMYPPQEWVSSLPESDLLPCQFLRCETILVYTAETTLDGMEAVWLVNTSTTFYWLT